MSKGAIIQGRLLALSKNNRQGWKGLPERKSLAYFACSSMTREKKFLALTSVENDIKPFSCILHFGANKLGCFNLANF